MNSWKPEYKNYIVRMSNVDKDLSEVNLIRNNYNANRFKQFTDCIENMILLETFLCKCDFLLSKKYETQQSPSKSRKGSQAPSQGKNQTGHSTRYQKQLQLAETKSQQHPSSKKRVMKATQKSKPTVSPSVPDLLVVLITPDSVNLARHVMRTLSGSPSDTTMQGKEVQNITYFCNEIKDQLDNIRTKIVSHLA